MKQSKTRISLFPNPFERGSNDYWRVRLFNAYLILALLVFGFFAIYNFTIVKLYANGFVDAVGLLLGLMTIAEYRINHNVQRTSWFVVVNVSVLTLVMIVVSPKDFGILMWAGFTPIFAFFLLGLRKGLLVTLTFYTVLLAYLFSVLGVQVNAHMMVEFVGVSLALCGVIYFYELNREVSYDLIHRASLEDALTGLHNRRWFNKSFENEYLRACRDQRSFCFFIMDIDHFKRYNDTRGHDMGDDVLRQVAQVLADSMRRSGDAVFRLGGEEFGGIFNSDTEEEALAHVELIHRSIEELNIEIVPRSGQVVTASFGFSITRADENIRATEIYRLTDQALYRAKKKGRNCVEVEHIQSARLHLAATE